MKYDGTAYTGLTDSGQGQATGCCEHGNEPSVFMKYGGFFDWENKSSHSLHSMELDEVSHEYMTLQCNKYGAAPANTGFL